MKVMSKNKKFQFDFDPEGFWSCTWQDKYGCGGDLEFCLDLVYNYIESENRDLDIIRYQLLKTGYASGFWWSIWYEYGSDLLDEETDVDDDFDYDKEVLCYYYQDPDRKRSPSIFPESINRRDSQARSLWHREIKR